MKQLSRDHHKNILRMEIKRKKTTEFNSDLTIPGCDFGLFLIQVALLLI